MGLQGRLLLEHVLQWPGQVFEHRVQDALFLFLLFVPAARRDGLLGPGQAPLAGLFQGSLLLGLFLLLLLQPILGAGKEESEGRKGRWGSPGAVVSTEVTP